MPDLVPRRLMAVGFVGDYRGGSDTLDHYRPVICDAGQGEGPYFVPSLDAWSVEDLRRVGAPDEGYLNFFPGEAWEIVSPASTVLVAGVNFYNRCSRLPGLDTYGTNIRANWHRLGAYAFRIGALSEFQDVVQGVWNRGLPQLFSALFSRVHLEPGLAAEYYSVLANLVGLRIADTWKMHAIYHFECRDTDQYALWRDLVVADGSAASSEEFDRLVYDLMEWLKQPRLSELRPMVGLRRGAPEGDPAPFEKDSSSIWDGETDGMRSALIDRVRGVLASNVSAQGFSSSKEARP